MINWMKIGGVILILVIVLIFFWKMSHRDRVDIAINLKVTSKAFGNGDSIPVMYTGIGEDVSPPLKLDKIAAEAKTIAIIMDDLDNPIGIYNHWVIWNIPARFDDIPEGIPRTEVVPSLGDAVQGKSGYGGKHWYRGPLPPFGVHRYIFRVYVLDNVLDLKSDAGKAELKKAMGSHILQYGTLTGRFGK
jgi:Raf kinase inhibitor-like YbhB/YbcL family protein